MNLHILHLRIKKRISQFLYRFIYPNTPFEIAYCDVEPHGIYENPDYAEVLASFDITDIKRHYIIFLPKK